MGSRMTTRDFRDVGISGIPQFAVLKLLGGLHLYRDSPIFRIDVKISRMHRWPLGISANLSESFMSLKSFRILL